MPKIREPAPLTTIGGRLSYWRQKRGYAKQGEFAALLGIKQGSLSELESNTSKSPSAAVLVAACELLKIRPRYLILGEEPAELQHFSEISGQEAQLVMMFRALPSDAARQAWLIDINAKMPPAPSTPKPVSSGESSGAPGGFGKTGTDNR